MNLAKSAIALLSSLALAASAFAQTPGNFVSHQPLTASAMNAALGAKQDYTTTPTFTGLNLSGLAGTVQCLHVNTLGQISGTNADCGTGGSGAPGGSSGQLQYNNGGVWGGLTISGDATLNTTTGALTVSGSGGSPFGSAAFANTSDFLGISNNLSDVASPSTARSNLGLGTLATQNAPTGSTQCLQANSSGTVSGTGAACGGAVTMTSATYSPAVAWHNVGSSAWVSVTASGYWVRTSNGSVAECHIYVLYTGTPSVGSGSGALQMSVPSALTLSSSYNGGGRIAQVTGFTGLSGAVYSSYNIPGNVFLLHYLGSGTDTMFSPSNVSNGMPITIQFDIEAAC